MSDEKTSQTPLDDSKANVEGDDTPSKSDSIPSHRLREETDKRRAAESRISELEGQNADRERKELEDQGKHEEVIASQKQEIDSLKATTRTMMFDQAIDRELNRRVKVSDPALRAERVEILSKSVDRSKLNIKDGQVTGLTEQTKEMEGRSTFKMLFGDDPGFNTETPPTDPNSTTADIKPNNQTKAVPGKVDVGALRGMNNDDFRKAAKAFGVDPI